MVRHRDMFFDARWSFAWLGSGAEEEPAVSFFYTCLLFPLACVPSFSFRICDCE